MDSKLTLSFDTEVVERAKKYSKKHNISLSRLIEFLLNKVTTTDYQSLEDFPISDWVSMVAEGEASYQTKRSRKASKNEFLNSKK